MRIRFFFGMYLLVQDIFHDSALDHLQFDRLVDEVDMEGKVSQVF